MTDDNTKHDSFYRSTGQKIRIIRIRKGIIAPKLAEQCKTTKTAISYYENDLRQVSVEKRKVIAKALGVSELALKDHRIETVLDSLYAFFEMEARGEVFPCKTESGNYVLCMNDVKLSRALMEWYEMYQKLDDHTITLNEYLDWKDHYAK